jgi:hypothetical protein
MALRIKGQEVSVALTTAAGLQDHIVDIQSVDITFMRDILSEGYIGQGTEQKDDIFNGVEGSFEMHARDGRFLDVAQTINDISRRRLPGEQIEIACTYNFPQLGSRRIIVPDCKFGEIPISTGGRSDYVMTTFNFAADDARIVSV